METANTGLLLRQAAETVATLRARGARVHCLTNTVAQNFTANVLLACGGTPSMTASASEARFLAARADALLVNLGTLDDDRRAAIRSCLEIADERAMPRVLDPVKCELSPPRLQFARELLHAGDFLLKANRTEAAVLAEAPAACRVITGPVDTVTVGGETIRLLNGSPMLDRVIATGCALGAVIAALRVHAEPRIAALAGLLWFGVAAEVAASGADGPGSFSVRFIDTLSTIDTEILLSGGRIE